VKVTWCQMEMMIIILSLKTLWAKGICKVH